MTKEDLKRKAEENIAFAKEVAQKLKDAHAVSEKKELIKEGFNKCRQKILKDLDDMAHDWDLTQEQRNFAWRLYEKFRKYSYKDS